MMLLQYPAVCPYLGWIEAYRDVRPLFPWLMAGFGFHLVYLTHRAVRRLQRRSRHAQRRQLADRRVP